MRTSKLGFTLIELVVVIVMLGIVAVTAAPKFLNLQRDARISAVMGVKAAMEDAARLAYAKASIDGLERAPRSAPRGGGSEGDPDYTPEGSPYVTTNIGPLELKYGYPEARAEDGGKDILDLIELGHEDWKEGDWENCNGSDDRCHDKGSSHTRIGFGIGHGPDDSGQGDIECYVRYIEPGGTDNPSDTMYLIKTKTDDC